MPNESPSARRVLIADDNEDSATMLSLIVKLQGHTVFTAFNGEQALELAEKERPDVLVLDIGMPQMDGYKVAQCIRRFPWGQRVKLIAATGYGEAQDVERAKAAGFDHHLLKPMEAEAIERLIRDEAPSNSAVTRWPNKRFR